MDSSQRTGVAIADGRPEDVTLSRWKGTAVMFLVAATAGPVMVINVAMHSVASASYRSFEALNGRFQTKAKGAPLQLMEHFALAVIGSGSGNVVIPEYREGRKAALIESGSFGGTWVNRGCIPSKMFAYTADAAMHVRRASQYGIGASVEVVDWSFIRDRIVDRIKETSDEDREERVESNHVTLFEGHAQFVGPHELVIDHDRHIETDQIVIATGGRPSVPEVVTREVEAEARIRYPKRAQPIVRMP